RPIHSCRRLWHGPPISVSDQRLPRSVSEPWSIRQSPNNDSRAATHRLTESALPDLARATGAGQPSNKGGELAAPCDLQFLQDVADIGLDRVLAQRESGSNLAVRMTVGDEWQDIALLECQAGKWIRAGRCMLAAHPRQQSPSRGGIQGRPT